VYSEYQKKQALLLYDQLKSVTKVIQRLEYPTRQSLYNWISARDGPPKEKAPRKRLNNIPGHRLHPSYEIKMNAIYRCFELGVNVQFVSEEIGYSRASIYTWRKKYIREEAYGLVNIKDDTRGKLPVGKPSSTIEVKKSTKTIQDMQMEIDILKETLNVLKKDPGFDMTALNNHEKAAVFDVLKRKYSLPFLLHKLLLPRSSYYYHHRKDVLIDKYVEIRQRIIELLNENFDDTAIVEFTPC